MLTQPELQSQSHHRISRQVKCAKHNRMPFQSQAPFTPPPPPFATLSNRQRNYLNALGCPSLLRPLSDQRKLPNALAQRFVVVRDLMCRLCAMIKATDRAEQSNAAASFWCSCSAVAAQLQLRQTV